MNLAAFFIPTALAWLYAMVGGIEFGLPAAWLLANTGERRRVGRYLSPVWEVTNVFAVMALTGLFVLFPGGVVTLSTSVRGPLLVAGGLLLVRAILVLVVFYAGVWRNWLSAVLAIISLALAATLAQIPLRFVAGGQPGIEIAIAAGALAVFGSLALASSFLSDRQGEESRLGSWARLWLMAAIACLAWLVSALLPIRPDLIIDPTFSPWWWTLLVLPFAAFWGATLVRHTRGMAISFIATSGGWWLFLFVHQRPYFFYPTTLLSQVVGSSFTVAVAVWSTAIFTILLLPFIIWLYRSALTQES